MKRPLLRKIFSAIFDKRLYGLNTFFFTSGPLLVLGFVIQALIYYALNRLTLFVYIPVFIILVLVSALGSKNIGREVTNIGYFRGFLFVLASFLASIAPFAVSQPADPLQASLQFIVLYSVSVLALTIAIVEITIYGQRISLRNSMELTEDFFKKQKKTWTEKLAGFPNSESIISHIDDARVVGKLFDNGSFGLAVLWSCNVMEQTIDAIADGIISVDPEKRSLFRKQENSPIRYPKQMETLGFRPDLDKNQEDERITTQNLWHEIRRNIAHYNYIPTFQETFGTVHILISFVKEMPEALQNWKPSGNGK